MLVFIGHLNCPNLLRVDLHLCINKFVPIYSYQIITPTIYMRISLGKKEVNVYYGIYIFIYMK